MEALRVDLAGSTRDPQNIGLAFGTGATPGSPELLRYRSTSDRVLARSNECQGQPYRRLMARCWQGLHWGQLVMHDGNAVCVQALCLLPHSTQECFIQLRF